MPDRRVLFISALPVGPRAAALTDDATTNRVGQLFALHVSVAVDGNAVIADALPWKLWPDNSTPQIKIRARASDGRYATFTATCLDDVKPDPGVDSARVRGWFTGPEFDPQLKPDGTPPGLAEQLGYAATLPGNIPRALCVVWHFKIPATADAGSQFNSGEDIDNFVAAPCVGAFSPVDNFSYDPNTAVKLTWSYNAPAGPQAIDAQLMPVRKQQSPTTNLRFDDEPVGGTVPGLSFDDYWLRSVPTNNWSDDLLPRCLEVTNPVARLVDFGHWLQLPKQQPTDVKALAATRAILLVAPARYLVPDLKKVATRVFQDVSKITPKPTADDVTTGWANLMKSSTPAEWCTTLLDALGIGRIGQPSSKDPTDWLFTLDRQVVDAMLEVLWAHESITGGSGNPFTRLDASTRRRLFLMDVRPDSETNPEAPAFLHRTAAAELCTSILSALDPKRRAPGTPPSTPRAAAIAASLAVLQTLPGDTASQSHLPFAKPADFQPAQALWSSYIADFVAKLWQDLPDGAAVAPGVDNTPRGLTIQFDEPNLDAGAKLDADPWRKVAGIGVIVRRVAAAGEKQGPWYFTNAGILDAAHGGPVEGATYPLPQLVPVRVPHRDGARYPFVTYNQRSLVAKNPLVDSPVIAKVSSPTQKTKQQQALFNYRPWVQRLHPGADKNECMRLLPLKFGKRYEMAGFIMDLAGGLPRGLASPTQPWLLDSALRSNPLTLLNKDGKSAVPKDVIVALDYVRTVPIGHPRLSALAVDATQDTVIDWPTIPESVAPLARELDVAQAPPQPSHGPFFLYEENTTLVIGVQPPSVDVEVIERHLAKRDEVSQLRTTHLQLQKSSATGDVAFDDPLVSGYAIQLEQYDFDKKDWQTASSLWVRAPVGKLQPPFRRGALRLVCKAGGAAQLVTDGTLGDWTTAVKVVTVTVPQPQPKQSGNVMRLSIYPLVAKSDANLLAAGIITPITLSDAQFSDCVALEPMQVLLETPSRDLPDAVTLWTALTLTAPDEARTISVSLMPAKSDIPLYRNIVRVELLRQPWRWRGRHLPDRTFGDWPEHNTVLTPNDDLLQWESGAFAELDDLLDSTVLPIGYPHLEAVGADWRMHLYEDLIGDLRAQYLRYGARVHSRYAGLFTRNTLPPVTTAMNAPPPSQPKRLPGVGWQRIFVPFAGAAPNKPPSLRGFVPLTVPDDINSVAPVLAIIDEPAFHLCGVSEQMVAEVVTSHSFDTNQPVLEYGRDPTLSAQRSDQKDGALKAVGPFGYTFDAAEARAPLYTSSGWMIRPLACAQPWDFARVRLRRATGRLSDKAQPTSEDAWTRPQWIQFLPAATFNCDWSRVRAAWQSGPRAVMTLPPGASLPSGFFYLGVLATRRITDFRGDTFHEGEPTVLKPDVAADGSVAVTLPKADPTQQTWLLRLIEVQATPAADGSVPAMTYGDGFWTALFPSDPQDPNQRQDAPFRITRVSPAVEIRRV